MQRPLFFLLFLLLPAARPFAQPLAVWPGDATNNGIVNNLDFLQLGLAYNYAGPPRQATATAWVPQAASPWTGQFADGTNFAYADCNGDGIVNYFYDAFPIYVHYGLTHGFVDSDAYVTGTPGVDPPLRFDSSGMPLQVVGGQSVSLPLVLGSAALPMENFYGIAFSIFVDRDFVDADAVALDFSALSWANPDNDRIYSVYPAGPERIDVGWVRTDHNERQGYGPFGTFDFIVIEDVVGVQQQFMLRIDSIRVIDRFGNETAVAGDTLQVTVVPDLTASEESPAPLAGLRVQPNPAVDGFSVEAPEAIRSLALTDATGRVVLQQQPGKRQWFCGLPPLPPGLYCLWVQTDRRVYNRKISIGL